MFTRICAIAAISVAALFGAALPAGAEGASAPTTTSADTGWSWQQ
ncbi:hypothetical protein [Haloactinospora alba]|nr:hypothetical protein [Haloactinospora alba]